MVSNKNTGIEIIEDEGYGTRDPGSIKKIILRHISRIADICCKEFVPSFYEKRPVKVGDGIAIAEIYHPDMREAYSNAVDFLCDVMFPSSDDTFKEFLKKWKEKSKKKKDEMLKDKDEDEWIPERQLLARELFQEINILFERIAFFEGEEYGE